MASFKTLRLAKARCRTQRVFLFLHPLTPSLGQARLQNFIAVDDIFKRTLAEYIRQRGKKFSARFNRALECGCEHPRSPRRTDSRGFEVLRPRQTTAAHSWVSGKNGGSRFKSQGKTRANGRSQ